MNIFSTDLFPHIEGSMLKETRVTMHIHNVNMKHMEGRDGDSVKTEVWLKERKKSALLNKTETRKLAMVYGPETNDWIGMPIVLYGEFGRWFGKEQWALRVDDVATIKAFKKHKPAKAKVATAAEVDAANDLFGLPTSAPVEQTEIPWDDDLFDEPEQGEIDWRSRIESDPHCTAATVASALAAAGHRSNEHEALNSIKKRFPDVDGASTQLSTADALAVWDRIVGGE